MRNRKTEKRMKKLEGLAPDAEGAGVPGRGGVRRLLLGWGSPGAQIREALGLLNARGPSKYAALVFSDVFPLPAKRLTRSGGESQRDRERRAERHRAVARLIRMETGIQAGRSVLKYDGPAALRRESPTVSKRRAQIELRLRNCETAWCPGCGNFAILECRKAALERMDKQAP